MSEIKTAQERYEKLSNPVLPDVAFRDCLKSEAAELRAAYEALQKELEQQLDVAREFCRQLQIENKQLKEQLTKAHEVYYKSEAYKNNVKFSVDMIK